MWYHRPVFTAGQSVIRSLPFTYRTHLQGGRTTGRVKNGQQGFNTEDKKQKIYCPHSFYIYILSALNISLTRCSLWAGKRCRCPPQRRTQVCRNWWCPMTSSKRCRWSLSVPASLHPSLRNHGCRTPRSPGWRQRTSLIGQKIIYMYIISHIIILYVTDRRTIVEAGGLRDKFVGPWYVWQEHLIIMQNLSLTFL